MDECDESELQSKFADRSVNPTVQDVSHLNQQWRCFQYGTNDNGEDVFSVLQADVEVYNEKWGPQGGKVAFQMFDTKANNDTVEEICDPLTHKKKTGKRKNCQPLIIAACTPWMARVHQSISNLRS